MGIGPLEAVVILALAVLPAVAVAKIATKAGLSPWLRATQLVPGVGLIGLIYLAFTEWPALSRSE